MRANVDRLIADFVLRLRKPSAEPSISDSISSSSARQSRDIDLSGGHRRPKASPDSRWPEAPTAFNFCTDVRQGLPAQPALDYRRIYHVEATTWGLESGFCPPPCVQPCPPAAPLAPNAPNAVPGDRWPPAVNPGAPAPSSPGILRRHPPQPFRLFDGSL